jgi:HK97 family phage prohead protease
VTETRAFPGALQVRAGGDGRTVTGLVAPYNTPTWIGGRFQETFVCGSFRLAPVPLHAGHPRDDRDMPVSPPGRVWEQPDGLAAEWHLSRTTTANDLLELIGDKAISGLSVGFVPNDLTDEWTRDGRAVTRWAADLVHVAAVPEPAYTGARVTSVRAEMASAAINDLPDSAFAYISAGGHKDSTGRTVPRDLRHLPIHDKAHVQNALARLDQTDISESAKAAALGRIKAAAKRFGVHVSEDAGRAVPARALVELRSVIPQYLRDLDGKRHPPRSPARLSGDEAERLAYRRLGDPYL